MKVALSIDALLERDRSVRLLNLLCGLFPDAPIYTLLYPGPGRHLGLVCERKIHASFLSRLAKTKGQVVPYAFALPSAARALSIPCHYDTVINVSRGLSHGIQRCAKAQQITLLCDDYFLEGTKIFRYYMTSWSKRHLKKATQLWTDSLSLYAHAEGKPSTLSFVPSLEAHVEEIALNL